MKLLVRAIDYYRKTILAGYMILKKPYNNVLYGVVRYTLLLDERSFIFEFQASAFKLAIP
jgi:hypothetical protein